MEKPASAWLEQATRVAEKYGLDPASIQDEVRKQLAQKIAQDIVKDLIAGRAGVA